MDNRDQIEEIKAKLDIVTVVQQYVPSLKRTGHNYFGLCPFHREKTPSFSVNSELGLFKCFGCGEGGDVIKFIEKIENLDFVNALQLSAEKAGVTLTRTLSAPDLKTKEEKQRLLSANKLTAQYYHYILVKHASGKIGRDYTEKRKLTPEIVKKFQLGYAPKSFNNLKNFLINKNFVESDLVKWGLLVEKNRKIYDKFRNRLMFPIMNHQGEVVGFSGRKIMEEDLGPKYLNSPETIVYKKSKLLFGLYQAKEAIRDKANVILVEGNVSILSSHKVGLGNIVAPLGTALTLDQLNLIKRYTDKIYFAFDTDNAGQKALLRSFFLAEQAGLESYVLDLLNYKDVDDLIVAGEDWAGINLRPQEAVDYFIHHLAAKYELKNSKEKAKYVDLIMSYVAVVKSNIAVADYVKKISEITDIAEETLIETLKAVQTKKPVDKNYYDSGEDLRPDPAQENYQKPNVQTANFVIPKTHMTLKSLMLEFISLAINNPEYKLDNELINNVLGSGVGFKIYQYLQTNPGLDIANQPKIDLELEKYQDLITEIRLRQGEKIKSEKLFYDLIKKLGQRIIKMKVKSEIHELKKSMLEDDSDTIKKIIASSKLLKR